MPAGLVEKQAEIAVALSFICNRRLFGQSYRGLMPDHVDTMGRQSGVMIGVRIPTRLIVPTAAFPGDIDLLVIPYENDRLLISHTLAIEVNVVRANYTKQAKAPDKCGFSQATAALSHGFPYSAVAQVITYASSPIDRWRKVAAVRPKNGVTGVVDRFKQIRVDMPAADLMDGTFGRLNAPCNNPSLGLVSAYLAFDSDEFWLPATKPATSNPNASAASLAGIAEFYEKNFRYFMDMPKYAP